MKLKNIKEYLDKVLLGDAFEYIQLFPDKSVDFIITDPMYDMDEDWMYWYHEQFLRISRHGVIVFMPPENPWVFPADQYLYWEKEHSTKNTKKSYARYMEEIFLYETNVWNTDRHWSNYGNVFHDLVDSTEISPYRKPPSLIERLILNHTKKDMIVFDPFAGSCVVAEVCMKIRRKFICIEEDELTFDKAVNNLQELFENFKV